jgi:ABC-type nitrate/sulfonate/bicarbonate transport system ATPase subunit
MPQDPSLLPWKQVADNLALALTLSGTSGRQARAIACDRLAELGLERVADSWPATLSAGMAQRVALLRTFLPGRGLVLLDEPLGQLDAITRRQVQTWLIDLWRRLPTTVLFVTHDVEEALRLADRVLVLSPRPGTLVLDRRLSFENRRDDAFLTSEPFLSEKRRLLHALATDPVPASA